MTGTLKRFLSFNIVSPCPQLADLKFIPKGVECRPPWG